MAHKTGKTTRDLFNHGAAGKGDKSRVTDEGVYRQNFSEIDFKPKVKTNDNEKTDNPNP